MSLALHKIEAPTSLSSIAYDAIKKSLLETDLAKFPAQQRLDERELADRLGISRTPLREAINRLVVEGFLRVVPRKGIYVVKKSKAEIIEILLVRSALEAMAARLTAKHATAEEIQMMKDVFSPFNQYNIIEKYLEYSDANIRFHELVLRTSRCGKLIELAGSLFDHMRWIRFRAAGFHARLVGIHGDHLQIIEAIEKKDPDMAEKRMRTHIEAFAKIVSNLPFARS